MSETPVLEPASLMAVPGSKARKKSGPKPKTPKEPVTAEAATELTPVRRGRRGPAPKHFQPAMRDTPVKMRVTHASGMPYDNVLLVYGQVFWYWHQELPEDWIAVEAEPHEQVGQVIDNTPPVDLKNPPPWTTAGFKTRHERGQGPRYGPPPAPPAYGTR